MIEQIEKLEEKLLMKRVQAFAEWFEVETGYSVHWLTLAFLYLFVLSWATDIAVTFQLYISESLSVWYLVFHSLVGLLILYLYTDWIPHVRRVIASAGGQVNNYSPSMRLGMLVFTVLTCLVIPADWSPASIWDAVDDALAIEEMVVIAILLYLCSCHSLPPGERKRRRLMRLSHA